MLTLRRIILIASCVGSCLLIARCTTAQKNDVKPGDAVTAPAGVAPEAADKATAPAKPTAGNEATPAAVDTADTAAQANLAAKEPANDALAAPAPAVATDGRRIWFVRENNVAIYAEPKDDAKVVGHLARGDHVLATISGTWASVDATQFIKADQLSDKPVGRAKVTKKKWDGSAAH